MLLFVVAVFNLNVVPSIAANGGVTIWLWIISLLLFFWPQGIAVIELAHRYPGEGGVYLWAKEVFGDFHGFLSGWCYWTNNMLYVPTVMLYFVGVSVYVLGPGHEALPDNKLFAACVSLALLALFTRFARRARKTMDSLNANAYGIYLLHYIGVIWMQCALLQTHLPTIAKIVLVWAGAVGLSWGITAMLRRVPAVSRIL